MRHHRSPGPLTILTAALILVAGFATAFLVTYLWPQVLWAGIMIAVFAAIGSVIMCSLATKRHWFLWILIPAVAMTGLGTVMFAQDLGVTRDSTVVDVVVTDHQVEKHRRISTTGRFRTRYTHKYSLERTDGTPVSQPLEYSGKPGFKGVDVGSQISVFLDPEESTPPELAEQVDVEAGKGLMIMFAIPTLVTFMACAIAAGRRRKRAERHMSLQPPTAGYHPPPPPGYYG